MNDRETSARFRQEDRRDMMPAALLSAGVHAILFVGLFSVFQWTTDAETVYAELWAPEAVSGGNDPQGVAEKISDAPAPKPNEAEERRESQEAEEAQAAKEAAEAEARERAAEEAAVRLKEEARREVERKEALAAAERERVEAEKAAQEAKRAEEARRAEEVRRAAERAEAERIEKARQDAIEAERRAEEKRVQEAAERLAQEKLAEERRVAAEVRRQAEAKRAEELRQAEEKRIAEEKRLEAEREAQRVAEEKKKAEAKRIADAKKAEEERKERERIRQAIRQQELARLNAKVDADANRSGTPTGDARNKRQNLTGKSLATYTARIIACVRPNISIDVPASTVRGQYTAEFIVKPLPNGELESAPAHVKKSGWDAYDAAVRTAILKCNPFPVPDKNYNTPKELRLRFDPVDDRH